MNAEIELPVVHDDALIKAGKQDVLAAAEGIDRDSQQSMVAPRVAAYD